MAPLPWHILGFRQIRSMPLSVAPQFCHEHLLSEYLGSEIPSLLLALLPFDVICNKGPFHETRQDNDTG